MKRHLNLLALAGLFATGVNASDISGTKPLEQPNILWLVSEDNSPYLGCYGDSLVHTPNLDALAVDGVVFDNAFANAPVCAPSRSTIISGMYASGLGTENMRSVYPIPASFRFFPQYLRDAGYYCTNHAKKDYNMPEPDGVWDESSKKAHYRKRTEGQPFFAVFNFAITHESKIHAHPIKLSVNPDQVTIAPYHPDLPEIRKDYAVYYHRMKQLDDQLGTMIAELKASGEWENTIVFYYSDHGGVLPFSKRFIKDSGTKVPMIIRVPDKFRHLMPFTKGERTDRIVNFVDLGPTVLSLAGIRPPENMQGIPFMGKYEEKPREYSIGFRARMDERIDLSRGIRTKCFHYIRNYMPHRIYGQHVDFLWKAASAKAWEAHYKAGNCNQEQSIFWQVKPTEELYDVANDPYEVNNLAGDPEYNKVLKKLRKANKKHILKIKDAGFIPEGEIVEISKEMPVFQKIREDGFPIEKIIETAEIASNGGDESIEILLDRLEDDNNAVRYWAATGLVINKSSSVKVIKALKKHLKDESGNVRLACAEALYYLEKNEDAIRVIIDELNSSNVKVALHAVNLVGIIGKDAAPYKKEIESICLLPKDKYILRGLSYWLKCN